jgi:multidrug efflux system outer membrane protein
MNLSVRFSNGKHWKHVVARSIMCTMLLALPACHIPTLRQAAPGRDLPQDFNGVTSPENSAELSVEEFYNDPTLTRLIDQGLAGNQDLRIITENVQIASNEVLARRGAYLPFVTVGGGASLSHPGKFTPEGALEDQLDVTPGHPFPNVLPNYMAGFNVFWQMDIWKQLRNARDAAQLRFLGAAEGRNYIVTRLVADVAENYYRLMSLDQRLATLDIIIDLQEKSLNVANEKWKNARGTLLPVQRFQAEVHKNKSEKLIINQEIIEVENRVNFALGRFPQPVERLSTNFIDLTIHKLDVGLPSQLIQYRPDIRQAERELAAAGLDVNVARARFFPTLTLTGAIGYEAFNPKYLFWTPESMAANIAGNLVAPLINKAAIRADYLTANAKQLQAVYNYQRVILNAFIEVISRLAMVQNYGKSIEIKKQQVKSLELAVDSATKLLANAQAGVDYMDVLFAQRDLMDARMVVISTKLQQISAIVNAYQALGGGQSGSTSTGISGMGKNCE